METVTYFEEKKREAKGTHEKLKAVNASEGEIADALIMLRFWEAMEQEAGEELGVLLFEFANLVHFDTKLLRPIAEKDAGFWSDIEGMGFLDFQLKRLELERSSQQISLLQRIDVSLKRLLGAFSEGGFIDKVEGQWTPEELKKLTDEATEKNEKELIKVLNPVEADLKLQGDHLEKRMKDRLAEIEEGEIDYDSLAEG